MSSNVASPPTLSTAVLARSTWLTEAILLAAGVLLIALSAQVTFHLPNTPVPISGQTFSVLLVGSAYGVWRGFSTVCAVSKSVLINASAPRSVSYLRTIFTRSCSRWSIDR